MADAVATSAGGYTQGGSAGNTGDQSMVEDDGSWKLEKCVQAYDTYLDNKVLEIEEQQNARRYRHGAQWTADQVKALNDRKQPVVTYNKIGRKIDGIVGLVERLKQDPKAFPRTPQHQQGADLATAVLRYLMDSNRWDEVAPLIAEAAAVDGLAGIELDLKTRPPTARQHAARRPARDGPQRRPAAATARQGCDFPPSTTTGFFTTRARSSTTSPTRAISAWASMWTRRCSRNCCPTWPTTSRPRSTHRANVTSSPTATRNGFRPTATSSRSGWSTSGTSTARLALGVVHRLQNPQAGHLAVLR